MSTELEVYDGDQLALIKRTFAKGTSDDEFALFMQTANRTGLSPLAKQIYAVMRWSKKDQREVMTIQTSIDGYRLVADRTGLADGQDGPYWCGEDEQWREVWFDRNPPKAARVVVYKRGASRGYPGVAHWDEYVQTDSKGNLTKFWQAMPALMLAKCAESLALRKAFPQELSGLYTVDEMAQAEQDTGPQPTPVRGKQGDAADPVQTSGSGKAGGATPGPDQTPEFGPPDSGGPQAPTQRESTSAASGASANLKAFQEACEALKLSGDDAVTWLRRGGWTLPKAWWKTIEGWSHDDLAEAIQYLEQGAQDPPAPPNTGDAA